MSRAINEKTKLMLIYGEIIYIIEKIMKEELYE